MQSITRSAIALSLGLATALPLAAVADEAQSTGAVEAISIAVDAYVYGYPLVGRDRGGSRPQIFASATPIRGAVMELTEQDWQTISKPLDHALDLPPCICAPRRRSSVTFAFTNGGRYQV